MIRIRTIKTEFLPLCQAHRQSQSIDELASRRTIHLGAEYKCIGIGSGLQSYNNRGVSSPCESSGLPSYDSGGRTF